MYIYKEPDTRTWEEELITQTNPLFKRINKKSPIIGPHATTSGQIIGNLFSMEENHFYKYSTQEQKEYYEHLKETNIPKAYEYLLAITNSVDVWKQDIQAIWYVRALLTTEEDGLKSGLKTLKKNLEEKQLKEIPHVLRRHIPEHIFDIDLNDIQSIAKLAEKEKVLTNYLNEVHEEMPFLFKNLR